MVEEWTKMTNPMIDFLFNWSQRLAILMGIIIVIKLAISIPVGENEIIPLKEEPSDDKEDD